jgi:23S rRNA pseudouridine2605 synthase/16S rRNA pseudouridine516 synthase
MIAEGRVEVDGQVVTELGVRVDPKTAVIHVDGLRIQLDENMVYLVFNKPKGVVSTMEDPDGRPCISDFVRSHHGERLFHVGRLDVGTEGLLLLTNDGELANRLTHPRYGVPKTYRAQLRGRISDRDIERLASGVKLEDGPTAPAEARRIGPSEIEITIREGRNRQVRRMLQRVGNEIASLQRVGFASLTLGDLPLGEARELSRSEVKRLWKDAGPVKASGDKPR